VKKKYEIYQRRTDRSFFLPLKMNEIDPNDYEKTFEGEIIGGNSTSTLDFLFKMFNSDERPTKDYTFSFSINDIIKLDNDYYICLFLGWNKIQSINIEHTIILPSI
jgi:hypothetical protein